MRDDVDLSHRDAVFNRVYSLGTTFTRCLTLAIVQEGSFAQHLRWDQYWQNSDRILTMRLNTTTGPVTFICAYAPTLTAVPEVKDEFYENLSDTIQKVSTKDQIILLGDFNARVGSDHEAWPMCIGKFNVGNMNDNGQRLLELCSRFQLCVANSFFYSKPQHKVSWQHPRSKHWHQLDLVLIRRSILNSVKIVRSYHSADCDTDHLLVCCKIKLCPKKMFFSKAKGKPRLNTANMQDPVLVSQFTDLFEKEYSTNESDPAEKRWQSLKSAMHSCALATFGKKKTKSSDWFEAKSKILNPIIEKRGKFSVITISTPVVKTCASFGKPGMRPRSWSDAVQMTTGWS